MKKRLIIFTTIAILFSQPFAVDAHQGRTDSSGGHRDNKNKSGLGPYHYHCGGHPAHLHTNGCPYKGGGESSAPTPKPQTPRTKPQIKPQITKESIVKKGAEEGYNAGYYMKENDGYNYSGEYSQEYREAYNSAFNKGREKIETKKLEAKENGYNDGIINKYNNIYDQEVLTNSYKDGFDQGNEEYKNKKIKEYEELAINDCKNNIEIRDFSKDIDSIYVDAYNEAYTKEYDRIKNEEYEKKGYNDGILDKYNNEVDSLYLESYKKGHQRGIDERNLIMKECFDMGYEGKDLNFSKEYELIKEILEKEYNKGKKQQEKESIMGAGVLGAGAIVGVGAIRNVKKRKNKN